MTSTDEPKSCMCDTPAMISRLCTWNIRLAQGSVGKTRQDRSVNERASRSLQHQKVQFRSSEEKKLAKQILDMWCISRISLKAYKLHGSSATLVCTSQDMLPGMYHSLFVVSGGLFSEAVRL